MTEKNFLGMKVEGKIHHSHSSNVDQISEQEVNDMFSAVLSLKRVKGIAWTQYTPYFNDGEPCEFRVGEPCFSIEGVETAEDEEYWAEYSFTEEDYEESGTQWFGTWNDQFQRVIGKCEGSYDRNTGKWTYTDHPVDEAMYYPLMALHSAMASGRCEVELLKKFGDHAHIKIDTVKGVVQVDEYEHE
jgi:hypothetical protein